MSRRIQWTTGPHQRLARSYSAKTRKTALLKFKFSLMKCSQFTTAVSLCLRRTKFTAMRNFSLARVFSFLSSSSPPLSLPPQYCYLSYGRFLSHFFSPFSSAFSLDATRCKVSSFILNSVLNLVQRLLAYQQCSYLTLLFLNIEYRIFLNYGVLILILFLFLHYIIFFLFVLNNNRECSHSYRFLFFYYKL